MSKKFTAIVSLILAICALVALASVPVSADTEATPVLSIEGASLSLTQNVALNFYVKADNVGTRDVDMLFYKSAQSSYDPDDADYVVSTHITSNIGGVDYLVFQASFLSAAMMGDDLYAVAHTGGYGEPDYLSAPVKYSVLAYYKAMRSKVDAATGKALDAMLAYGAAVQELQNYKTDALVNSESLCYVKVKDGKLADKTSYTIVPAGTAVTFTANNKFNGVFAGWRIEGTTEIISTDASYTATVTADTVYEAVYTEVISYMGYDFNGNNKNGAVSASPRNSASCIIGFTENNGVYTGSATGYPFRGTVTVDSVNGTFALAVLNSTTVYNAKATVDSASGLMIVEDYYGTANSYILLAPVKALAANGNAIAANDDVKVSAWNGNVTIASYDGVNIAIIDGNVTFGVQFVAKDGTAIAANEAFNNDYIAIKKNGEIIKAYAKSGNKFVENAHCIYANDNYFFINANGSASVGENAATATAIDANNYCVKTSNKNYTVNVVAGTAVENNVTITFANTDIAALVTAKDIAITLPDYTPAAAGSSFAGWYSDAEFKNAITGDYNPTADATVYAKIVTSVTIYFNINDGIRTTPVSVTVPEGATLATAAAEVDLVLDAKGINLAASKKFIGWTIEGEIVDAETTISAENNGVTLDGSWSDVPVYYGNYKGTEIWGNTYGNSSTITVSIDESGKITGNTSAAGTITAYDPVTGKITNGNKYYIGFDAASGILVFNYSSNVADFGTDCYVLSKYATTNKLDAAYGLGCINPADSSKTGYYAHFVVIETANGKENALIYGTDIYAGITLKTSAGVDVTVATIKDAKTLCVYDANDNLIVAFATTAENFGKGNGNKEVTALDPYFGTYTNGADTVVLDGTGIITYGEKTGTYTKAPTDADYGFDVFFNNNTEYCKLTLDGTSFTIVKPMVTVTFVSDKTAVAAISVNTNVAIELPAPENANFVFRGWHTDDTLATAASNIFTADTTIYAKWLEKVTVTVHDNIPGNEAVVKVYGKGEIPSDIADPAKLGLTFVGWYTDADFTAGNEFANTNPVNATCEIYAKWEEAPAFNRDYNGLVMITGTTANGGSQDTDDRTGWLKIDSNGNGKGTSYPYYNMNISIVYTDKAAGKITMTIDGTAYNGMVDNDTGIMLVCVGAQYYFYVPDITSSTFEAKISTSYWNGGKIRVLSYVDGEINVTFFVNNGAIVKDVSFTDEKNNSVAAKDAYKANALFVKNANNDVIYSAGYNGTTMVAFDGTQGTYTAGTDTLVLYGTGKASMNGGDAFDYTKISDTVIGFFSAGAYYEATIDFDAKTAAIAMPMVTVTYVTAYGTAEAASVNKNVEFILPVLTDDAHILRGWCDGEAAPVAKFTPTADITLTAKWDDKVALTIVYGNGLDNAVFYFGAGDAIDMSKYAPRAKDGKAFKEWCSDEACANVFTATTITANITVYCHWIDAVSFYGEYTGWNLYGAGSDMNKTYVTAYTLNVAPDGTITGNKTGKAAEAVNGVFNTTSNYFYFNEDFGVIWTAYGSNSTGVNNDTNIFFRKGTVSKVSILKYKADISGSAYTFLMKVYCTNGSVHYIAGFNNVIYDDVTFTAEGEFEKFTTSTKMTVSDKNGNVIFTK